MSDHNSTGSDSVQAVVLSDEVIRRMLTLEETIPLVEGAFALSVSGGTVALPVVVKAIEPFQAQYGIKSSYIKLPSAGSVNSQVIDFLLANSADGLGLKSGGYWTKNSEKGLPGHRAVMLLLNPETGEVAALMSANWITRLRTAAIAAIGAKYLARENSETAAIIGAGEQAHAQLEALRLARPISKAYVWARRYDAAAGYANQWKDSGLDVEPVKEISEATLKADIVITTTPSREALISVDMIRPGTQITAVGSDSRGKQELSVDLLSRSKVVVDNIDQSLEIGELEGAVRQGLDARKMVHAELGELCAGIKQGRQSDEEITILDSSGVSFQDLVVAAYLLRRARTEGLGQVFSI